MAFLFGLFIGNLVTFAFAAIACVFMTDERDDEMQAFYEANYRKENKTNEKP